MKKPFFNICGLTVGYRHDPIVQDIDLVVDRGELVGIIGPNGSGKTTLLRAMTRVLKPWIGEVLIDGENIWHSSQKDIAKGLAVVSQMLDPVGMTVLEYVMLGRIPYYGRSQIFDSGKDYDIANHYIDLMGIESLSGLMMNEISGGERQLAQIAKALAQEPSILILDEPTAHLDITHQVRIMDLIKRLNRTMDLTVVMVLHDLNLASEYCGRLALLNEGRLYKVGSPEDVLTYQVIEEVYDTHVIVEKNPLSKKPFVLLVTEEEMGRRKGGKGLGEVMNVFKGAVTME
ncbi:MAG: ABC transporter ATP-binding protein [Kiritimatiellae bacterium]|nr:ABC transporter ATP-binding protein [Kiritimatiellia bacterium]